MPHSVRKLLLDLTLACTETSEFCAGKDLAAFQADRVLQLAVERQFEIIGEALARLERLDPANLAQKIPEYRQIIGFRNLIAHGYDTIDDASLWDFVVNRVPDLLEKV
ncbi:MAG: DUF86 domain-containing protein [bacterium]|nr:DUF86 domain-containing protein [bacterium]MDI1335933.1 DUF86 domain-containing protein [Lacunisphaera sp.]